MRKSKKTKGSSSKSPSKSVQRRLAIQLSRNEQVERLKDEILQTINLWSDSIELTHSVVRTAKDCAVAAIATIYLDDPDEDDIYEDPEEDEPDLVDLFGNMDDFSGGDIDD